MTNINSCFFDWLKVHHKGGKTNYAMLSILLQKIVSNSSNRISIDDLPNAFNRLNLNKYLADLEKLNLIVVGSKNDDGFYFTPNHELISKINK